MFQNLHFFKLIITLSFLCTFICVKAQSKDLVILASSFEGKTSIKASLPIDVLTLDVSYSDELLSGLKDMLENHPTLENVHLFSETTQNAMVLGNDVFDNSTLDVYTTILDGINNSRQNSTVKLFIYSCSLAGNADGISFLTDLGAKTKFNVLSASDCETILQEDFTFDFSSTDNIVPITTIFH